MSNASSETNVPIGEWTLGSLKVHHDDMIDALKELTERRFLDQDKAVQAALVSQEKAVAAALAAAKEAVGKADSEIKDWKKGTNEWRGTLNDFTARAILRPEYEANNKALTDKTDAKVDSLVKAVDELKASRESLGGQKIGKDETWKVILTIIGVGIAILGYLSTK